MRKLSSSKFLFALFLLATGSVLLLVNLNLISLEIMNIFYNLFPYLLLVLSLFWLLQWVQNKRKSGKLFWGLFMLLFSCFLIADRLGYIYFGFWDFWKLWPFILIYHAFRILFGKKMPVKIEYQDKMDDFGPVIHIHTGRKDKKKENSLNEEVEVEYQESNADEEQLERVEEKVRTAIQEAISKVEGISDENLKKVIIETLDHSLSKENLKQVMKISDRKTKKGAKDNNLQVNVFGMKIGDVEYNSPNWSLEPIFLENTVANYFIDLSKAFIPEGETPIVLKGKMGDIEVLIPEDLAVKINVYNSVGDVTIFDNSYPAVGSGKEYFYESPDYELASRKIKLEIHLSIGSVQIDRV